MIKPVPKVTIFNTHAFRAIDGDSFVAITDISPLLPDATDWAPHIRVMGVDSAEKGEPDWAKHRSWLEDWLTAGAFDLICYGREKYGRLLADAKRGDSLLSAHLLALGTPKLAEHKLLDLAGWSNSWARSQK